MIQEVLKAVPLFRELDEEELTLVLMISLVKRYPAGSPILTEGAAGGRLHVILEGQVRISKVVPGMGEEALTILAAGEVFGEVEFFDGSPASAHVIAHSDCEVLALPHREVEALMKTHPGLSAKFLWAFGRTLATRLRDANHKMAALFAISRDF